MCDNNAHALELREAKLSSAPLEADRQERWGKADGTVFGALRCPRYQKMLVQLNPIQSGYAVHLFFTQ